MTPEQLACLSAAHFAAMSAAQLAVITPDKLKAMEAAAKAAAGSGGAGAVVAAQLAVLRDIKAAGAAGLATWSVQKLAALTPLQMQASALYAVRHFLPPNSSQWTRAEIRHHKAWLSKGG
jgi:hypothetical protein